MIGEDEATSRGGIYREPRADWSQPWREDRVGMGIDADRARPCCRDLARTELHGV